MSETESKIFGGGIKHGVIDRPFKGEIHLPKVLGLVGERTRELEWKGVGKVSSLQIEVGDLCGTPSNRVGVGTLYHRLLN